MYIGAVESVSLQSVVFRNVLKVYGMQAKVKALPLPYVLETNDRCSYPKLIPGKTYLFNKDNIFTGFIDDSFLQPLHFIISKCSPRITTHRKSTNMPFCILSTHTKAECMLTPAQQLDPELQNVTKAIMNR